MLKMATISFNREIKIPKENIKLLIDAMKEKTEVRSELPNPMSRIEESRQKLRNARISSGASRRTFG